MTPSLKKSSRILNSEKSKAIGAYQMIVDFIMPLYEVGYKPGVCSLILGWGNHYNNLYIHTHVPSILYCGVLPNCRESMIWMVVVATRVVSSSTQLTTVPFRPLPTELIVTLDISGRAF